MSGLNLFFAENSKDINRFEIRMNSGGAERSRTALDGFAIRCITALLPRHS